MLKWQVSTQIGTSRTRQLHSLLLMATTWRKHVKDWCHCARIRRSDSSTRDFSVKSQFKRCIKRRFRMNALRKRTTLTKVQSLNRPIQQHAKNLAVLFHRPDKTRTTRPCITLSRKDCQIRRARDRARFCEGTSTLKVKSLQISYSSFRRQAV